MRFNFFLSIKSKYFSIFWITTLVKKTINQYYLFVFELLLFFLNDL